MPMFFNGSPFPQMPGQTPPYAPDRQASPMQMPAQEPMAAIPQPQQPAGFTPQPYTAPKRTLSEKLGLLADAFAGNTNNAQMIAMRDRQGRADWATHQQMEFERWKAANQRPQINDTVADYEFRARTLGKQAADDWLRSASDPMVTVTLPGNRVYSGPRSGLATALGGGNGQQPAIGAVVADPRKGGPVQSAPGMFPIR